MSERVFPDDPSQWPQNPYELLGVPQDVSPRDLKRAYTALIRQFKPEQKPEEFRRIRQAYEMISQFIEWGIAFSPASASDAVSVDDSAAAPIAASSDGDDADRFWQQAIDGDPHAGYAGLRDLSLRFPLRADLALRLYWLATLFPNVDPQRRAVDWLIAAVRDHGPSTAAYELLQREMFDRPAESLPPTRTLMNLDWPPAALQDFARARWLAALKLREWDAIRDDLDRLESRLQSLDEAGWLRLQFTVIDIVAWWSDDAAAGELQARCHDEIRRLEHRAMQDLYSFDRLDYLFALAPPWRAVRRDIRLPPSLVELIPLSWSAPFHRLRPLFERVLEEIVAQPKSWLGWFDELYERAPMALDHFVQLLSQYQDRLEAPPIEPHTPAQLAPLIADFVAQLNVRTYSSMRPAILSFCLDESVGAEMVAAVAPPVAIHSHHPAVRNLQMAMSLDLPLRFVCWASRLFWA